MHIIYQGHGWWKRCYSYLCISEFPGDQFVTTSNKEHRSFGSRITARASTTCNFIDMYFLQWFKLLGLRLIYNVSAETVQFFLLNFRFS